MRGILILFDAHVDGWYECLRKHFYASVLDVRVDSCDRTSFYDYRLCKAKSNNARVT